MNETLELPSPAELPVVKMDVDVSKLDTAMPLEEVFKPYQTVLDKWAAKAASLIVTDIGQKTEMKIAREARLELRQARCALENRRKELVENLKTRTSKIDGVARMVRMKIEALEEELRASEEFADRYAAKAKAELKAKREAEINPFRDVPSLGDISDLSEADYQTALADAKLLRQTKLDAAAKAEADRLAKEAADRAERERIAAENARLKAEAEETTKRLEAERKAREAQAAEERAKREAEQKRVESERAAERKKLEAERDRIEATAKAERLEAAKLVEKLRAEREAEARKAAVEQSRLRAEFQARIDADQARIKAEQEAGETIARRAAAAPDKAKLMAYISEINDVPIPILTSLVDVATVEAERVTFVRQILKITNALPTQTDDAKLL